MVAVAKESCNNEAATAAPVEPVTARLPLNALILLTFFKALSGRRTTADAAAVAPPAIVLEGKTGASFDGDKLQYFCTHTHAQYTHTSRSHDKHTRVCCSIGNKRPAVWVFRSIIPFCFYCNIRICFYATVRTYGFKVRNARDCLRASFEYRSITRLLQR